MMSVAGVGKAVAGLLFALILLGGCSGRTFGTDFTPGPAILSPAQLAGQSVRGCEADDLGGLQGQHFTKLAEVKLAGQLRILRPGQGLTRDLMHDRLNVQIDESGMVLRMFCG